MFDDISACQYVEKLRAWLELCAPALAEFHRRNASGWHTWKNSDFKRWLFAFSEHTDICQPKGRRRVRRYMDAPALKQYFTDDDRWLVSDNLDDDYDSPANDVSCEPEIKNLQPALLQSLEWFKQPPASSDPLFVANSLLKCKIPSAATRWCRKNFSVLKSGIKAQDYLANVGYPIGVPSVNVLMMLTRWGWSDNKLMLSEQFQDVISRLAHSCTLNPSSVSFLFSMAAGQEKWREYTIAGVCHSTRPACDICVLNELCSYREAKPSDAVSPQKHSILIKDMPVKPREKLVREGAQKLTDEELLAIILRVGLKDCSVVDLAKKIISHFGSLSRVLEAGAGELMEVSGIKLAKAAQIIAALELGKRAQKQSAEAGRNKVPLTDSSKIFQIFHHKYYDEIQEVFVVLLLNSKLEVLREAEISRGTINKTAVSPREIFRLAIREAANAILCIHNHPSGNPAPSEEDRRLTKAIYQTGETVNIHLIDHIILGRDDFYSFSDNNALHD